MAEDEVGRRIVFHVGGYDPMSPAASHRRFRRELARFATTWSVTTDATDLAVGPDLAAWAVTTSGPNWTVRTAVRLVRWDDVIGRESREPAWRRLPRGLLAFADFVAGGAFWGYCRRAWRYALFFLYPYLLLASAAGLAILAGASLSHASGSGAAGAVGGVLVAAGLVGWAGARLSLNHLLDDWIFSRRYLRRDDPVLGPRLDRIAAELARSAQAREADEILVVGHSLGAVLAVDLVDRALALDPSLGQVGPRLALVTAGSSIPKLGLHRAATRLRAAIRRVATAPGLFWVEYQALTDAMNFYKTNPAALCGVSEGAGPLVRIARISRMLEREYYGRIKRNFFRVHNQFVSANDRRALYDFFMLVCGPVPVEAQARSKDGAVSRFGPDGRLLAAPVTQDGEPARSPT